MNPVFAKQLAQRTVTLIGKLQGLQCFLKTRLLQSQKTGHERGVLQIQGSPELFKGTPFAPLDKGLESIHKSPLVPGCDQPLEKSQPQAVIDRDMHLPTLR